MVEEARLGLEEFQVGLVLVEMPRLGGKGGFVGSGDCRLGMQW